MYINIVRANHQQVHDKWSYFVFETIVMFLSIINSLYGLILTMHERGKHRDAPTTSKLMNVIHLCFNAICTIPCSLIFTIEFIRWCSHILHYDPIRNDLRLIIISLTLIIGLCQIGCIIENRILAWSPKYRYSRFALCFSSIMLVSISTTSVIVNRRMRHMDQGVETSDRLPVWCYLTLEASSICALVGAFVGISLAFIYRSRENGQNQYRQRIRHFFYILCTISLSLVIIFTVVCLTHYKTHSILLLYIGECILLLISMTCLHILVRASRCDRHGLRVERVRLDQTLPTYLTYWASAIDTFSGTPEGMTGDAALQLMTAYENGQLENTECAILRVSRLGRCISIPDNQWDDTEALVLLTIVHSYNVMNSTHFNGFWGTVLKRTFASDYCIQHFRPFLFRFGLIGYQWPFRSGIFFTAPHPDPVTRAAHVLETIIDWNAMQKYHTHCNVLLLPSMSTELIAKAIPLANFFPFTLPPTHLLDLRPHHGKTWNEYMKTLKKDNRRPYIQQFLAKGGTIEEVHNLSSHEIGEIICERWENTARLRRANKEPSTLVRPSVEFIVAMGNHMQEKYRSVLLLRFNNEVIASAVIYKFPHKLITFDMPGLIHEKARQFKAYFVMLHWTMREALEKKYDFIDYGPTTPGPKIDLGCTSVPLEVGGYARNPILAFGIQQAGRSLDTLHKKKNTQQQIVCQPKRKKQDQFQLDNNDLRDQNLSIDVTSQHLPENQNQAKDNFQKHISTLPSVTMEKVNTSQSEHRCVIHSAGQLNSLNIDFDLIQFNS